MNTDKLRAKDLITTAVFTVLFSLILFACSMTIGMIPLTYPFLMAVAAVPGGIVWAYMRVKVPKRLTVLMQCVVMTLLFLLAGVGWFGAVGAIVGGVAAELITGAGRYRNYALNTLGYAAFCFCVHAGMFLIVLVARDYYYDYCITNGMDAAYMDTLMRFMNWPVLIGSGVLAVIGAIVGMLLGRALLKKHFVKAGML
jgi:energy-coupling factor transport system substrate-specific component